MEGVGMASIARPVFDRHQRIQHLLLMVSFILLALTGLPMKFHDLSVSQWWIGVWGGMDTARSIHHFAAYLMVADCVYHLAYLGYTTLILRRPLPVKIIPGPRDFLDLFRELQYFVGLRKDRPKFDRFNWREKFDYWAIFWGMPVMCLTGAIMLWPVWFTGFLPGWVVPASFIAHGDEAILAVSWILIIHFAFNHLPPGTFPLNKSIFTGKVPKERYRHEHPQEYERDLEIMEEGQS
jgi:cytochrome b subunit of formate dehydrogenase